MLTRNSRKRSTKGFNRFNEIIYMSNTDSIQKTILVKVFGKVQGVGFRWCCYEQFVDLGLKGEAKNLPDGSLEITAAGDVENLKNFLRWCQKGPMGAQVEKMDYQTVESIEPTVENKPAEAY